MEWMVELEDGQIYGPVNIFAVDHLVEEKAARPDAQIQHVKTGKKHRANETARMQLDEIREQREWLQTRESQYGETLKKIRELLRGKPEPLPPPQVLRSRIRKN
jgi:hypothetical protein